MKELILIFAELLTEDEILDELGKALEERKTNKSEENDAKVYGYAFMLISKKSIQNMGTDVAGFLKKVKTLGELQKAHEQNSPVGSRADGAPE